MPETPVKLMRQSTIGDGHICLGRLAHRHHWNPDVHVTTEEALTGTVAHAIVEAQAWLQKDGRAYDPYEVAMAAAIAEIEANERVMWRSEKDGSTGDVDVVVNRAMDMADYYITKHWFADPEIMTIVGIELRFELPWIPGWNASGTVDLLTMDSAGWLYVVDYKFPRVKKRPGWERARNSPQMAWYFQWVHLWWAEAYPDDWEAHGPRPMKGIYDVTSWGTGLDFRQFEATVTPYERTWVLEQGKNMAALIDQGPDGLYILNPTHHLCDHKWCDFHRECPGGEALNNQ